MLAVLVQPLQHGRNHNIEGKKGSRISIEQDTHNSLFTLVTESSR